jgi:hypothetical protein
VAGGPEPPLQILVGPIQRLAPNAVVNWLGIMRPDLPEAPVPAGATFDATDPANQHQDAAGRVLYDGPASNLMTPATQAVLDDLLDRLDADGTTGRLRILGAFDDQAPNRRRMGCALQLRHEEVPLERLGALAHQAGFDYVKHVTVPSDPGLRYVYASVWRGEDLSGQLADDPALLVDFGLLDPGERTELAEQAVAWLCVAPDVRAWQPPPPDHFSGGPYAPELEPLTDATYDWCLTRYGPGAGRLDTPPAEACKQLTAERAGVVGARVELVLGDGVEPYRFELVVTSDSGTVPPLPKPVYDDLLNVVEAHLPIGVEARTLGLRAHVPELQADPDRRDLGTAQTYPSYRQPRRTGEPVTTTAELAEVVCPCPPTDPS